MNPLLVTGIWCVLTLGALAFLATEAYRSIRDYLYQKRANADTAPAARLLAIKASVLAAGMFLFFGAGMIAFLPPYSTPPKTFELKSVVVQSLLIGGQVFYFLDGVYLFLLRRLARDRYQREAQEKEKLQLTRDELTEEIRENRRIFAELGQRIEKSLEEIYEKLERESRS